MCVYACDINKIISVLQCILFIQMMFNHSICYRKIIESDNSEDDKPKSKTKQKKSTDTEVKEVTKNMKNVSITNKSQKKKPDINSEGKIFYYCIRLFITI